MTDSLVSLNPEQIASFDIQIKFSIYDQSVFYNRTVSIYARIVNDTEYKI